MCNGVNKVKSTSMEKMQISGEELKAIIVDILSEIDKICKENNLTYVLMYGTLLGAVRHKGFIPWDDDVDIAMPIEDYNKLIQIFNKVSGDKYFLQCVDTDKSYWLTYAKVRRIDTLFAEKNLRKRTGQKGIFVDIFPMFYLPERCENREISKMVKKYQYLKGIACDKQNVEANYGRKVKILAKLLPISSKRLLVKSTAKFSREKSERIIMPGDSNANMTEKYVFCAKDFFPTRDMVFEGKIFQGAQNADAVLTQLYGDYMKLPPEEQRQTNHATDEIRFLSEEEIIQLKRQIEENK